MPQPSRPCSRCRHWEISIDRRDSAAMAGCPLAGRRTAFDETCREWAALVPTLNQDARRQAMGFRHVREGD